MAATPLASTLRCRGTLPAWSGSRLRGGHRCRPLGDARLAAGVAAAAVPAGALAAGTAAVV
eukprot:11763299-Alexandrium_andersonii.AAC.1